MEDLAYTDHSITRMAQRNFSQADVCYIIEHGRKIYRAGTRMYFLGADDVPECDRRKQCYWRLVGSVVQTRLEADNWLWIITVYRNCEKGLKQHRKKTKYDRRRRSV